MPDTAPERIAAWRAARAAETIPELARRIERRRGRQQHCIVLPDPERWHISAACRLWRCKGAGWSRNPRDADRLPGTVARRIVRLMRADGLPAEAIRIPDYSSDGR